MIFAGVLTRVSAGRPALIIGWYVLFVASIAARVASMYGWDVFPLWITDVIGTVSSVVVISIMVYTDEPAPPMPPMSPVTIKEHAVINVCIHIGISMFIVVMGIVPVVLLPVFGGMSVVIPLTAPTASVIHLLVVLVTTTAYGIYGKHKYAVPLALQTPLILAAVLYNTVFVVTNPVRFDTYSFPAPNVMNYNAVEPEWVYSPPPMYVGVCVLLLLESAAALAGLIFAIYAAVFEREADAVETKKDAEVRAPDEEKEDAPAEAEVANETPNETPAPEEIAADE